jgi:hypothetical protein
MQALHANPASRALNEVKRKVLAASRACGGRIWQFQNWVKVGLQPIQVC